LIPSGTSSALMSTLLRALPRRHKRKVFVAERHYMG
jgi:hypothetical protein